MYFIWLWDDYTFNFGMIVHIIITCEILNRTVNIDLRVCLPEHFKQLKMTANDLYPCLRKIISLWRYFGFFPFSFNESICFAPKYILPSVINCIVIVTSLFISLKPQTWKSYHNWAYLTFGLTVSLHLVFRFGLIRKINESLIISLKTIIRVDKMMKRTGFIQEQKMFICRSFTNAVIFWSTILVTLYLFPVWFWSPLALIFVYVQFLWQFSIFMTIDILSLIHRYFTVLRENIEFLRRNTYKVHPGYKLEILIFSYDSLCDVSAIVNNGLSVNYLWYISEALLMCLWLSYLLVVYFFPSLTRPLIAEGNPFSWYVPCATLFKLTLYILQVVEVAYETHEEVSE